MFTLSERLRLELNSKGASLIGFASLEDLPADQRKGFTYGISAAVALDPAIVNGIGNGPTKEYLSEYKRVNEILDGIALRAAEVIEEAGFKAFAQTRANVQIDSFDHSTVLPHKTVATKAGMGWIGKSALLVTESFGSAVRITSILTDAPLETGEPVIYSKCGTCTNCVRNCPGEALAGNLWFAGMEREAFYNFQACRNKTVERSWRIKQGETICGLCILVCPWTKKYIEASKINYDFPSVDFASKGDYEELLELQKLSFQSEAELYNNYEIAPLKETLEQLKAHARDRIILKIVEDNKIVGSVRAYEKDGTCHIGRLIVHPDYQNRGYGKKLMLAVEKCFTHVRYELYTGHKSEKNLGLYRSLGYKNMDASCEDGAVNLVYLEKNGS